ncbi:MAG: L,D-transpeptidase [Bacteroidaceae bacterium]|nr:L,D-transpeptidase [Bacteroidaceae bacterium]
MYRKLILMAMLALPMLAAAGNRIIVSKKALQLYVVNDRNDTIFRCPISCGKNFGNKTEIGDFKTPEGDFKIKMMYDATSWKHDFGDGKGMRKGAYGPLFFRLNVPGFNDIGIHGTIFPESIGTRSSEGCVRLRNEDIKKLYRYCYNGMPVRIEKDEITE